MASCAPSPMRKPAWMMRVYPPARSAKRGAISSNSFFVAAGVSRYDAAWRRVCSESRLPRVIIRSTSGRVALARLMVVVMRSRSMTLVTRLRSVARRCAGLRPSFDPELRCRIASLAGLQADILLCCRRGGLAGKRRPDDAPVLIEFHAQRQTHAGQDFLDFVERFSPEVLGLQHFVLGFLNQLANRLDVGVLQAIVGAHRQ